jgi:hypothetical protein
MTTNTSPKDQAALIHQMVQACLEAAVAAIKAEAERHDLDDLLQVLDERGMADSRPLHSVDFGYQGAVLTVGVYADGRLRVKAPPVGALFGSLHGCLVIGCFSVEPEADATAGGPYLAVSAPGEPLVLCPISHPRPPIYPDDTSDRTASCASEALVSQVKN